MEKKECWSCFGSGVVQESCERGYYGVCQECQGDGHLYYIADKEISKAEYEQLESRRRDADYDDD